MSFPQGINFRATAGYVTDGANEHGEIATTANYPTTSTQGNNVGWEAAPSGTRDRNNLLDVRLAGIHYGFNDTPIDYRIDLSGTGSWISRIAAGDGTNPSQEKVELFDTSSSLGVLCDQSVAIASFADALDVEYTAVNWPGSNSPATDTFTTTICRFRLGGNASGGVVTIAHVYVEAVGGGSASAALLVLNPNIRGSLSGLRTGIQ